MYVNEFYRQCAVLSELDQIVRSDNRPLVLSECIKKLCQLLKAGTSTTDILAVLSDMIEVRYQDAWFAFPWQRTLEIKNDLYCFQRFLEWFGSKKRCVIDVNIPIEYNVKAVSLQDNISMVVTEGNEVVAYYLFFRKADKSPGGKSTHTCIGTDLHPLVAKRCKESKYPGLKISMVYLSNTEDTAQKMVSHFVEGTTKKSNIFTLDFKQYYDEDGLNYEMMDTVISHVLHEPLTKNCFDCQRRDLCKVPSLDHSLYVAPQEQKTAYTMPKFTPRQEQVVFHKDGPLLVCAAPGSGKTAVLVGRTKRLIDDGIAPELILGITFTTDAAEELHSRMLSFCQEGASPKVCTINALGYEILRDNANLFDGGIELLDPMSQLRLVKSLIKGLPPLSGIKYDLEKGKNGLYKSVCNKVNKYLAAESPEAFFLTEPALGSDFAEFAEMYKFICRERGYITFDEQVILCNKLFKEHPDILAIYQTLYKYVMVDEYQDINAEQAEFIYQLAGHKNLVVVGDDDQSIYGFRGGDNRFMIEFPQKFNAKTIVLSDNFRSTQALVDAAQKVIKNNQARIQKQITSRRESGVDPVIINGSSMDKIEEVLAKCIKQGYSYGDIAILSSKNAPLEDLKASLHVPCVLARSFLRDDGLFLLVKDALALYSNVNDDISFFHLLKMMGVKGFSSRPVGSSLYAAIVQLGYPSVFDFDAYAVMDAQDMIQKTMYFLSNTFFFLEQKPHAKEFVFFCASMMHMELSNSFHALLDLIDSQGLYEVSQLAEYIQQMILFEDETRIPVIQGDRILLITNHESKGREFKIVLMLDDFLDETEESRRLFYVAMTRAKDALYVLKTDDNETFLNEIK